MLDSDIIRADCITIRKKDFEELKRIGYELAESVTDLSSNPYHYDLVDEWNNIISSIEERVEK